MLLHCAWNSQDFFVLPWCIGFSIFAKLQRWFPQLSFFSLENNFSPSDKPSCLLFKCAKSHIKCCFGVFCVFVAKSMKTSEWTALKCNYWTVWLHAALVWVLKAIECMFNVVFHCWKRFFIYPANFCFLLLLCFCFCDKIPCMAVALSSCAFAWIGFVWFIVAHQLQLFFPVRTKEKLQFCVRKKNVSFLHTEVMPSENSDWLLLTVVCASKVKSQPARLKYIIPWFLCVLFWLCTDVCCGLQVWVLWGGQVEEIRQLVINEPCVFIICCEEGQCFRFGVQSCDLCGVIHANTRTREEATFFKFSRCELNEKLFVNGTRQTPEFVTWLLLFSDVRHRPEGLNVFPTFAFVNDKGCHMSSGFLLCICKSFSTDSQFDVKTSTALVWKNDNDKKNMWCFHYLLLLLNQWLQKKTCIPVCM